MGDNNQHKDKKEPKASQEGILMGSNVQLPFLSHIPAEADDQLAGPCN